MRNITKTVIRRRQKKYYQENKEKIKQRERNKYKTMSTEERNKIKER